MPNRRYTVHTIVPRHWRWLLGISNAAEKSGRWKLARRIRGSIPGIRYEVEFLTPWQWKLRKYGQA